jgi:hypothetical protein
MELALKFEGAKSDGTCGGARPQEEEFVNRIQFVWPRALALALGLALHAGCGGFIPPAPAPLSASNVNLVFVVSEDLSYNASGDVNPNTANLTNKGLQRSLLMGSFLKQSVLGGNNVTGIYALEPMTHLQTANNYPDLVSLETIQQFAMLNQVSVPYQGSPGPTANSFPIFSSYLLGAIPNDVAPPVWHCPGCQGLDFKDENGDNESIVSGIIAANNPGFYVFSAPWETIIALMTNINQSEDYNLRLPFSAPWETINALMTNINQSEHYNLKLSADYAGPNMVYAISIASEGASLTMYNGGFTPASVYPALAPLQNFSAPCSATPFHIQVQGGSGGAVVPKSINTNETVYMIRHAEAHPVPNWDDGNYIAPGQWRALLLPQALQGKVHPTQVYSIDPAVGIHSGLIDGVITSSYVRPSLTVEPYAIANNLPFNLAASVPVFAQNSPQLSTYASNFFFTQGTFSNETLLVAWEHDHIPPTVNALLASFGSSQVAPNWPDNDYDTIWTIKLDSQGNLTVDNGMCEGIGSSLLPATAPQF